LGGKAYFNGKDMPGIQSRPVLFSFPAASYFSSTKIPFSEKEFNFFSIRTIAVFAYLICSKITHYYLSFFEILLL